MDAATAHDDKRASIRRPVAHSLRVSELRGNGFVGELVNLSRGGFMLVSKTPMQTRLTLWLVLELPRAVEGRRRVNVEARCVLCQQSSCSADYGAGFEIETISDDDRRRLGILYGGLK